MTSGAAKPGAAGAACAAGRVLEGGARGLDGHAIDLTESHAAVPAVDLLDRLIDHVRPALDAVGDYDMARAELARIAEHGNGAMRQRRAWQRSHDVADVLAEAAAATLRVTVRSAAVRRKRGLSVAGTAAGLDGERQRA